MKQHSAMGFWTRGNILVVGALTLSMIVTLGLGDRAFGNGEGQQVTVSYGDTLWSIAEAHNQEGHDVRELVRILKEVNHLNGQYLHAGQKLIVPMHW